MPWLHSWQPASARILPDFSLSFFALAQLQTCLLHPQPSAVWLLPPQGPIIIATCCCSCCCCKLREPPLEFGHLNGLPNWKILLGWPLVYNATELRSFGADMEFSLEKETVYIRCGLRILSYRAVWVCSVGCEGNDTSHSKYLRLQALLH